MLDKEKLAFIIVAFNSDFYFSADYYGLKYLR